MKQMNAQILKNKLLEIEYSTDALRITGITPAGKPNLLVDLSAAAPIPTPYGDFHFQGGHRLWHAPEAMPRTYIPDRGTITVTDLPDGVRLTAQTEPGSFIRKEIEIRLAADMPCATLVHTLTNDGLWPIELAPWAITQFRLGGTVILPLPADKADPAGLLPNRQFSFWPYARLTDPRLEWDDRWIFFHAQPALPPFKVGYLNSHGWMAYWIEGVLFRKSFELKAGLSYPDNSSNAEIYCGDQFVELESLGPLTILQPGAAVQHIETWEVLEGTGSLPEDLQQRLTAASQLH
jgi:hypothetical protein